MERDNIIQEILTETKMQGYMNFGQAMKLLKAYKEKEDE